MFDRESEGRLRLIPREGKPFLVKFKDGGWSRLYAKGPIEAALVARRGMVGLPVPDGEEECTTPPEVDTVTPLA